MKREGETSPPAPPSQAAPEEAPFLGQGPRLTGSGLFFLKGERHRSQTTASPSPPQTFPRGLSPVSVVRVPIAQPSPSLRAGFPQVEFARKC